MHIRLATTILFIAFCAAASHGQTPSNADRVKALITRSLADKPKASIFFKSLISGEGKITGAGDTSFSLRFRTKGGKRVTKDYRFDHVLQIKVGKDELNFLAPINARPHGEWDDIRFVYPGTRISILLEDNKTFNGWFNSATGEEIVALNESAKEKISIERAKVVAFYGVLGRSGGIKSGASKGSEGMLNDPLLGGIGAGLGAIAGGLFRSDGRLILVFSR